LENLRFYAAEEGSKELEGGKKEKEKKETIEKFRNELTQLGDIYVNDAFGTSHRAHSSIVGCKLPYKAAGFLLKKELEYFSKIIENPDRPLLVILGGAKVKDKIQLIKNLTDKVDKMIITGGMAFTFLKTIKNMQIGKSIYDEEGANTVEEIVKKAKERNVELIFPEDFVIASEIKEGVSTSVVKLEEGIPSDKLGIDVGPKTLEKFHKVITGSKTIFLNGANGIFELNVARLGSVKLVESLVEATKKGAYTICGGGDTISLVNSVQGASSVISHLSTGGGASLELLEGKSLPGIDYLSNLDELKI
jgi:phosphoglycerate kinase